MESILLSSKDQPKPWTCRKPYRHPLPTSVEDPWIPLMRSLLEKKTERCQAWEKEVQNVLVVASLSSAVVTAFLIESYKVLGLTAQSLREAQNPPGSAIFTLPVQACTRINAFWFLSLVLTLSTVLIGIVCLQWLREHQRSYGRLEPQIAFSLLRMQEESLDRWFLPQIFALPSLILQAALLVFLLGVNDLLWHLDRTVALSVTVAIGLTFIFLAATTVLPALQAISAFFPSSRRRNRPSAPCPYKSPQSWAFHVITSFFVKAVTHLFGKQEQLQNYLKIDSRDLTSAKGRADWLDLMPRGTGMLFRDVRGDTWLEHAVAWLFQRDFEYMSFSAQGEEALQPFAKRPVPLYDAIQGLLDAKHANPSQMDFAAVDHCIGLTLTMNDMYAGAKKPYALFFHHLSLSQRLIFGVPPGTVIDDPHVLQDEATLRFFSRNGTFYNLPSKARWRYIEICIRLTGWMYGGDRARRCEDPRDIYGDVLPHNLPIQWVVHILETTENEPEDIGELQGQVCGIVLRFFERAKSVEPFQLQHGSTLDTTEYLGYFLSAASRIMTYGGSHDICDKILNCIQERCGNSDYVYQAALMFCHAILSRNVSVLSPSLRTLIIALFQYEAEANAKGPETGGLRQPLVFHQYSNWRRFVERVRNLGLEYEGELRDHKIHPESEHAGDRPDHCVIDIGAFRHGTPCTLQFEKL